MSNAQAVTSAEFDSVVLAASTTRPVLVDFWAPWCGPCRTLGPVLDQIASEFDGRVTVVKLNTDEAQDIAARYQIRSIPAVKLFHGGKVAAEFVGAQPLGAVRAFLAQHLPRESPPALDLARAAVTRRDYAAAIAQLGALAADRPGDHEVAIELARAQALSGDPAAARTTLGRLPPALQSDLPVKSAYALAHFAELRAAPDETDVIQTARVQAARALLAADLDRGIDALIAAMQRNRRFAQGQGREDMLLAFDLAPADHPRVAQARRQLAALLH
jgi:putative thioredoxin